MTTTQPSLTHELISADVTVVGGGLAGVCAAIAAARAGAAVSLIQNRPVLGGNSSSEVRVWVCGATAHGQQRNARETGIMGELFVENQFRNPQGNPYYWDLVVLEAVRAEPNLTLFLNTDVREVAASPAEEGVEISSVIGWQLGSEKVFTFVSPAFIDATGDGLVGYLAGADHRTGRESFAQTGEQWAPAEPDANTLGSTILFSSHDTGRPERFVPPSFTRDISTTEILDTRPIGLEAYGCAYWWIEWGGERDVVADNELIRDELQAIVYGIWDHIKNSGEFDAENHTLDWIGAVPGKREYRRFLGDYVLNQHDVLDQVTFDDPIGFGGWSIDLHPPGGVYATGPGSRHWYPDGVYDIPLRCLYSRNVTNLWLAGRDISATHVAFGTTRVMATCAVTGEAAGLAAALSVHHELSPRTLATERFELMRQALVRADASIVGVEHTDPVDLALSAEASSSSTLTSIITDAPADTHALTTPLGVVVPVNPLLDGVRLLIDAARNTDLVVELHDMSRPQNYVPHRLLQTVTVAVPEGERQWVTVPLTWAPDTAQNAFLVLRGEDLAIQMSASAEPGLMAHRLRERPADGNDQEWRPWKPLANGLVPCLQVAHTEAYHERQVIGGYARPYGGPQMWVSEPLMKDPEPWVELRWPETVDIGEIALVFDDDVDVDLINLHHHTTPDVVLPTLVHNYRVEAAVAGGGVQVVCEVVDNHVRHRRHVLPQQVTTDRLRLVITATNGAPSAHVVSIRAWQN